MYRELVDILKANSMTVATVESCTGGMIASHIVDVSGASSVFGYGFVTYADEAKKNMVGVSASTLADYGAVSREAASEMAEGGKRTSGADICISVTGVAGPNTDEGKPVGLVYIGICLNESRVYECHFEGDRESIRTQAAYEAVRLALLFIKEALNGNQ